MKDKPDITITQKVPSTSEVLQAIRKALAEAPLVQEVLAHPERYEEWYKKSREVLNG